MRFGRYLAAIIFVTLMFLMAQLTAMDMLIFPEMLALLIGMLCSDKMPWKTDGVRSVIMMTLSAAIGVTIVNLSPFAMYFQALIGISAVALIIMLSDCTLMPCIAACLFAVYFEETSILYPCAVALMTFIVVRIRNFFINRGKLEASVKFRYLPDFEMDIKLWVLVILAYALISAIPLLSGFPLFIAPPLAVTLAESSAKDLSGKRVKIWFILTVASIIGVIARFGIVDILGFPEFVAAAVAAIFLLLELRLMNMVFPPAGAVTLLAFLVEGNTFGYPLMIAAGAAAVLAVSSFIYNRLEEYDG